MPKIPLRYAENGLFVAGIVANPRFPPAPVLFLVDTGAGTTSISVKDQLTMSVDPFQMGLPRCKRRIITAGGKTSAFELSDSLICVQDEDGNPVSLEIDIILMMERERKISKSKRDKERKKFNESTPSIMGRDLLEKHHIIFHVDFQAKTGHLIVP